MFAQVKPTLDRKDAGLGIGLALARALAELHGGTLEARSAGPGHGSEFTLRMALAAPPETGNEVAAPMTTQTTAARAVRILIADDNRDAADSLEMLLTLEHHAVRVAYDGERAFAVMAEFRPQIALLDIGMPGLNGYELAAKVREQPWGAAVHLVAVTGWGQEDDRRRALAVGFDTHLVKPVDFTEVGALCARVAAKGPQP